ncbi:MAG: acetyl-CoA carboxylase subunit beta [Nitrospinae bacterium RIFCSPLOWO2_12_FULL_45_22]|nr:MAG: acetyl-CoA carboxylase subunit beta [Nitrospinae bacterium RIFCSPLOWO2_12_FULL_45_22]
MWFARNKTELKKIGDNNKLDIPEGLWIKCNACKAIVYKKEVEKNSKVCPKCNYHFRISAQERIDLLTDPSTFEEVDSLLTTADPLKFKDSKRYPERVNQANKALGIREAVICGSGRLNNTLIQLCIFEFNFMGGSMGSVVGEKISRSIERAIDQHIPLAIVSCSGGARMQEGILSLMQMAKVSSCLAKFFKQGLPYISILTDPTTGGVSASLAMLGDIIIAEPGALIGFAGPRVIEQTIKQKLPEGFQRAEFLLKHGMIDMVVARRELKQTIGNIINHLGFN